MSTAEAVDLARLFTADLATDPTKRLLSDSQLTSLLRANGAKVPGEVPTRLVRLAAADALDTVARSEVLVSKKIRTQDVSTDGPAVAAELRAQAASLRAQAAVELAEEIDTADGAGPLIVSFTGRS